MHPDTRPQQADTLVRLVPEHQIPGAETGDQGHYQDIFKDSQTALDEAKAIEVFEKAAYLNSEDKWVTPIYLSQRLPAEQASTMGREIVPVSP